MSNDEIATYLGYKGYTIMKENLTIEEQELIRKELTVKPFVPKTSLSQPTPFPIYRESKKKMYIPRFYGQEYYGEPEETRILDTPKLNINFKGELRDFQKPIVNKYIQEAKKKWRWIIRNTLWCRKNSYGIKYNFTIKSKNTCYRS